MLKHTSTKRGRNHTPSPDPETLIRFAELLKLRGLAISTQEEYLRFVRKLTARTPLTVSGLFGPVRLLVMDK